MAEKLQFSLVSPERELFSGEVDQVDVPGTEGDFGVWEVTPDKEVVWKFSTSGFFWRAYHYDKTSEAIVNLK